MFVNLTDLCCLRRRKHTYSRPFGRLDAEVGGSGWSPRLTVVYGNYQDAEELQTILVGIKAALNSKPITQDDENETLTPAHFLTGGRLTAIPQGPEPIRTQSLTRAFQQRHPLLLDGQHHFTKLLILQTRVRLHHLGVRKSVPS